ncbi:MAG: purine-binding chemotaxis protein CheW [Pirellulaceae bacterium]|nr:purine-binding chemotaxis protein CheW [Pirellulaceae bacterium]
MFTIKTESLVREVHPREATASTQLVGFRLAGEEYGVEITKVQEIILMDAITRVPQTPAYVKGLINLRNMVIPIIDLRLYFGLPEAKPTEETRIMVVNLHGKTIGVIVDAVTEVLRIGSDQVSPPPPTVAGLGRAYLIGLVRLDDRLLILLDIDHLLTEEEATDMESMNATARRAPN